MIMTGKTYLNNIMVPPMIMTGKNISKLHHGTSMIMTGKTYLNNIMVPP